MSQSDHAARMREMAAYATWIAMSYSETAPDVSVKYERNSVALTAGAEALERVAVLERELTEARKDEARLDWVIRNFEEVNFDAWFDYADTEAVDANEENETLAAWRKYIDAAMEGE